MSVKKRINEYHFNITLIGTGTSAQEAWEEDIYNYHGETLGDFEAESVREIVKTEDFAEPMELNQWGGEIKSDTSMNFKNLK